MPGSPFPDSFRPDLVGVIIVPMRWRDRPAFVLLPAGNDASSQMVAWMQNFAQSTGAPFYYSERGQRLGYGPPEFQREMLAKLARGEKLW